MCGIASHAHAQRPDSLEIPFALRLVGDSLTLLSAGPLRPTPDR